MACPGQMGGPFTECDVQVTDSDMGHGVCVHKSALQLYISSVVYIF